MRDLRSLSICFLAGTLGQGGAERQLYYILRGLRDCGTRVRLLCLTRGEVWQERIERLDVPVTWVGRYRNSLARLSSIVAALRGYPHDIVQSQHFYTNLYTVAAARASGTSEIGAVRNNVDSEVSALRRPLGRWSLTWPRVIAANSKSGLRAAVRFGVPETRLRLLPNVIDTTQFEPALGLPKAGVTILAVGRCVEQKRLDRFLSILAGVRKASQAKVRGWVVGDGPLRPSLEKQAADLNLGPDAVGFKGIVRDVTEVYRAADILLVTSDWEGTPNVILEAMACGLPVVASMVGDAPDIVEDGRTGYLFEPENESKAVEVLSGLADNAGLRSTIGANARRYVEANHSLDRLPQILEAFYRRVLA